VPRFHDLSVPLSLANFLNSQYVRKILGITKNFLTNPNVVIHRTKVVGMGNAHYIGIDPCIVGIMVRSVLTCSVISLLLACPIGSSELPRDVEKNLRTNAGNLQGSRVASHKNVGHFV